jgi:hypothetical protein
MEIRAMSELEKSTNNVVEGFRELRRFCNDISLLLKEANKMMAESKWQRISNRIKVIETVGDIDKPIYWLPDAFFCFYELATKKNLLSYISIHVDDLQSEMPDYVKEPIISAGLLDFGSNRNAVKEWSKRYYVSYLHLWIPDRKDNGEVFSGDVATIMEDTDDFQLGAVKAATFAHPLEVITNSEILKEKIVTPLLKLIC